MKKVKSRHIIYSICLILAATMILCFSGISSEASGRHSHYYKKIRKIISKKDSSKVNTTKSPTVLPNKDIESDSSSSEENI